MQKRKNKKPSGGFEYYRTKKQILEYLKIPPAIKLRWLDEMRVFNKLVAKDNPSIGIIQEKFRKGEI